MNHPEADLTIHSTQLLDYFTDLGVLNPVLVVEESVLPPNSEKLITPSNLIITKLVLLKLKQVNCLLNRFLGILVQIVHQLYQKRLKPHVTG